MNQPIDLENLPAELQGRIEECCEDFEQSWQNGDSPSLEQTLFDFTPPTRSVLLKELILIERYYRLRESGKIVSEQDLLNEHPELAEELSQLFTASHSARTRIADQSGSGSIDNSGSITIQETRPHFEQFPARFGRYQILSRLGEGGMGCVYLARDTQLERKVALKLPQIDKHADPQFISRFYREARAAANLNHPNLCSVYDVDEIDGVHYITMEFIEGKSLAALIQSGQRFSQHEIALLIQQLSQALELAHQQGIVHRDLKPANIMIRQDGTPIITDFGLALMIQNEEATQITQHGQIMGSPSYMSPEQVDGDLEIIGSASDVYSLGVIMYELLAGQRPFQGSTASILSQIMTKDPRPVRNIQPDIDSRLDQICRKMMARLPEKRYTTMLDVSQVLTNWLETKQAASSRKRVSPGKLLMGMTLAAVLLLGFTFLKPSTSQGTLHVILNDHRAQILLDGQPLDVKSGTWSGKQKAGSHELSLQIGDQRLPWGELTTVKSNGSERRVLASVNGIHIKNGRFEISPEDIKSAEIRLNWLPMNTADKKNEVTNLVTSQTEPPVSQTTNANPFAYEREVTEWLIKRGGIVRFNMAHDFKFNVKDIEALPDEPFRLKSIAFHENRKMPLTDLSRLNQLMTLEELILENSGVTPPALENVHFKKAFQTLRIVRTPLKVSNLISIQGLEFVDTLELSGSQIDDHFEFLKLMPNLRALEIGDISQAALQELSQSPLLSKSKLRFLRLRYARKFDDTLIQQLQTARPGMTITAKGPEIKNQYLGIPVAKLAADQLLKLGSTMKGEVRGQGVQIFTKENLPPDTVPFALSKVTLPQRLELTPEIAEHLAALPQCYGIHTSNIKNADLLANIPVLRMCSGVHLFKSDISEAAFEKLALQDPDGFFNLDGTQVSKRLIKQLDHDYPHLSIFSKHGKALRRLEILYDERKKTENKKVNQPEESPTPLTDDEQLAFERDTAEWVIGLGGKVSLKKPHGIESLVFSVDQLPAEPFRILTVTFEKSDQKVTLPNLSRLSRLLTLHSLNISDCNLQPGALQGLEFGTSMTHFHMARTPAKTSDLSKTKGLENLDTFEVSASQVNDRFQFLDQMPNLRDFRLWTPITRSLNDLAKSSGFKQTNLRFLNLYTDGRVFDSPAIHELQSEKPGMSIIVNAPKQRPRYLGIPVAREAAIELLNRGCVIEAPGPDQIFIPFNKSHSPSETELFTPLTVILPPGLEFTPEIAEAFSRLPPFIKLESEGVKNADLLAAVPLLCLSSGVQLTDSDLSDQGFETFFRNHPDGYLHAKGTRITKEKADQVDREFRFAAFNTDYVTGMRWLAEKQRSESEPE
ncbi:serine/threonine protein kinase [Gimesia maris]|uniref:Serine/threonine-protein kinase PrkC n=1 Tax=Gimesia maris TaxID=122 RepID=A0ABX5YNP1_9PLAN|nr:serine/threonine-protein kinase [Gimesia maris]EDL62222.1 serine/threonine kinase Pkn10 [Gimesia maris DSM 8797]QEG17371.1 Serine/threonine-protein kinase PrkC [Gimesia maris]